MEALIEQVPRINQESILEDDQLVTLCQQFDAVAQKALYDKYATVMLRTCQRYLPDFMEAEDAMTEGFIKALSKIDKFEYRGKGSLSGWIKRIMVNECLMLLRKKKYDNLDLSAIRDLASLDTNIESQLVEEVILKQITQLPKGYRTIFNMYVIEGYSHREIGQRLNISENTSKSQLSKARASLAKSLKSLDIL